jgi:predicted nucleic acid-binding protein
MNVVDASAHANLLLAELADVDARHLDAELSAPDVFLVEVSTALRRAVLRGQLDADRGAALVAELVDAPIELVPARGLVERAFELRDRVSMADACYIALAEQRECALITSDARLARTPGLTVPIMLV